MRYVLLYFCLYLEREQGLFENNKKQEKKNEGKITLV